MMRFWIRDDEAMDDASVPDRLSAIEPLLDPVRARTFAFDRPSETASSDHNLEHDDMAMMANFDVV